MKPNDLIVPSSKIHTPAFVVPLGKCLVNTQINPQNADDARVADGFRKTLELFEIGSPQRTYYDTMLANALMVSNGMRSKSERRDAMLREAEKQRCEMDEAACQRDRFWERFRGGIDLVIVGGLLLTVCSFVASIPRVEDLLGGSKEGYATIATTLGGVLIWSAIRARLDQRRYFKSSRYYRKTCGRVWKLYRVSVKKEYYRALNSVNIAWKQMTGETPPDAEITKEVMDALLQENADYDEINGDAPSTSFLREFFELFGARRRK